MSLKQRVSSRTERERLRSLARKLTDDGALEWGH